MSENNHDNTCDFGDETDEEIAEESYPDDGDWDDEEDEPDDDDAMLYWL